MPRPNHHHHHEDDDNDDDNDDDDVENDKGRHFKGTRKGRN